MTARRQQLARSADDYQGAFLAKALTSGRVGQPLDAIIKPGFGGKQMSSLNKVMLIGRLGRDPELRYTQGNSAVATLSVATSEVWADRQSGEKKEKTEWHRVVVWGKQAETCEKYLQKGRLVYVEGRLQTREYQDRDGNRRWTTEINASRVQFLGAAGDARTGMPDEPPPPGDQDTSVDEGFSDEEIPF